MWKPDLKGFSGPIYEQIRSAFLADIKKGILRPGDKLPPHRNLADDLGISVGTVSKAYKDLVDRGLIDAGSRRGSHVREFATTTPDLELSKANSLPTVLDLRGHRAAYDGWGTDMQQAILDIGLQSDLRKLLEYQPNPGLLHHREAGARWLEVTSGKQSNADEIVVCNGAQHALICALLATCQVGDLIATEQLTYAGLRSAASALGLRLTPIDIDKEGVIPDSFENACREQPVKTLVCVPNIHNPTTRTLPQKRRTEIAEIASRYGVMIIEDDVYGGLADLKVDPFYSIDPDNVIRITGYSKTLGPGLRVGYIQATTSRIPALATALRATSWMASPIMAEIAANLVDSGKAQAILEKNKVELEARNQVLQEQLGSQELATSRFAPHAWLELPESWTKDDFLNWSQTNGLKFLAAESFIVGSNSRNPAVRISVSAAPSVEALRSAAQCIEHCLRLPPEDDNILA